MNIPKLKITQMKSISSLKKVALILSISILSNASTLAQISLKNSNWKSSKDKVMLVFKFGKDTLTIQNQETKEVINQLIFVQLNDSLVVQQLNNNVGCEASKGIYLLKFQNNGQHFFINLVKDDCLERSTLLNNPEPLSFIPLTNRAVRDWSKLDIETDSIVGISLYKAYELLKYRISKPVIVAVIDNGVDIEHEDLKNIIWTNTKEFQGNGIDDDHNGYVDDVHGWNFRGAKDGSTVENEQNVSTHIYATLKNKYESADTSKLKNTEKKEWKIYTKAKKEYFQNIKNSKDSTDFKYALNLNYDSSQLLEDNPLNPNEHNYGNPFMKLSPNLSHGTHVAGIIAAQRNNNKGVDGISDNVIIMPLLAATGTGDERDKDVANAITYAVDNGAKIINMSFGKYFTTNKEALDKAIRYAEKKKVLIFHAAGNDGSNNDLDNTFPNAYYENGKKASNFITVGWTRAKFDARLAHQFSNYGIKTVDLFAPGSDIFSTVLGNLYEGKSGTSMASPCVAGVAAILFSYFPNLSMQQVKDILLESTFKPDIMVNRLNSKEKFHFKSLSVTGGILNAYNAVKMAISIADKK
jgi:cell wall-associated protease